MRPYITALVDTHNHERYIEQALVSVLDQGLSASELEIVVVDDGSTDTAPAIIEKFLPRIKHIRKKNGGQASAFNAGFSEAHGQIVALLDGDDWWAKGKLTTVIEALEKNPNVFAVSHAYHQYFEKTQETKLCGPPQAVVYNLATPEAVRAALRGWIFLQPSALTVRRSLLERIMPIPEVLVFSADAPIATAAMAMGVLVLPQPLSYYRIHPDNLYAGEPSDKTKVRRRSEMDETMCSVTWPMLIGLGVSEECVAALLNPVWVSASRFNLRTYGGSRLKTLRTEMRIFHSEYGNPNVAYRLFKHLFVGAATLLLSPRHFYRMRDWYAQNDLKRFRGRIFKERVTARKESE